MSPTRFGRLSRFSSMSRLEEVPPEISVELKPLDGGMDTSIAAWDQRMVQPPVKSPLSSNTRIRQGVVGKAYGLTELGAVSAQTDKNVMLVEEYEKLDGTRLLMRIMIAALERWDGTSWLALNGALSGVNTIYPSAMTVNDLFLFANGVDKIQKWDGNDLTAVANFSASSPVCRYLAYFLGRVLAADIVGPPRDTERILVSDDVDISDFAGGNSDDIILEEDSTERPSPIHGMSFLFARFYVYRKHSIWLGKPTGVATAPIQFVESSTDVGLLSPKSLSRYEPVGDIFLGTDKQVYVFSGGAQPIPVGSPIHADLRDSISDASKVYGVVDLDQHRYWLMAPTFGSTRCNLAWVWEIDPWIEEKRLVWTRRVLPTEMVSLGFGDVPRPGTSGFIDNETRFIDQITELADDWQLAETFRVAVFGGADGKTRYPDPMGFVDENFGSIEGAHTLPQIGQAGVELWLDTVYIEYRSGIQTQVEISFSGDGGASYTNPRTVTLPAAIEGSTQPQFVGVNYEQFIPKIRFIDDNRPEIIGVRFVLRPRGPVR